MRIKSVSVSSVEEGKAPAMSLPLITQLDHGVGPLYSSGTGSGGNEGSKRPAKVAAGLLFGVVMVFFVSMRLRNQGGGCSN